MTNLNSCESSLGTKKASKQLVEKQLQVVSQEHEVKAVNELQRLQPLRCYASARHSRSKQGDSTSCTQTKSVKSKVEPFIQIKPVYPA